MQKSSEFLVVSKSSYLLASFGRVACHTSLIAGAFVVIAAALKNFFGLQYKVAFQRRFFKATNKVPVSAVDTSLDEVIPFRPAYVQTYMDFTTFWIRIVGFLIKTASDKRLGSAAIKDIRGFLNTIAAIYLHAAEVYRVNMSTTKRPAYYGNFQFVVIHLVDPHLMCIPSLHVMLAIASYTMFADIMGKWRQDEALHALSGPVRGHALAISSSILFVKQHSVNCISAAMYAMYKFNARLFPLNEAYQFVKDLPLGEIPGEIQTKIIEYIRKKFDLFLKQGENSGDWKAPLLDFLSQNDPSF
ncbi:MAG: hypothetical protein LBM77_12435 [Spirochaetaceae bacterium]|jgi:hypothetical protein|nr:hypothetical protein [Spirochaetaceae bacterium]